jgi:glycosyltransferase involved in cell wall biosynthesis
MKLLALTRYYPHKNLEILVDLFQQYREELEDVSIIVTIEESQHAGAKKLLERIKSNKLENKIVNIGPVDQALLPALFAKVDALMLPTLLESFTGTYIEAMQFQKPILTSDRDFAHAVCDDAALYFDPLSVDDIKAKLLTFVEDEALRTTLRERGLDRRNTLSAEWEDIVKDALSTIASLRKAG